MRPFHSIALAALVMLVMLVMVVMAPLPLHGQTDDMRLIRLLLGSDYAGVTAILEERNAVLLLEVADADPGQAAVLGERLRLPGRLPATNTLALGESNYGLGLVSTLLAGELEVEQVNLLFCDGRVGALQILFDDRESFGDTAQLFSRLYGMGPAVPFGSHQPWFRYPLPGVIYDDEGRWSLRSGGSPVTVWDMGTHEGLYQPVGGGGPVSGQFWIAHREPAVPCADDAGRSRLGQ